MPTNYKPKPKPTPTPPQRLIPKPRLSPAEIERKRTKPAGYCAQAFQDQKRVLKNKQTRAENRLGKDGFKRKGIIMDMFASPEGIAVMAAVLVGLNAMGSIARSIGAGLAGMVFGNTKIGGSAARISRPGDEIIPNGNAPTPAPGKSRNRKPKYGMGGSGGEDTGTAPVSSRRRDTSTAAPPVPVQAPLTKRQISDRQGDRIRDRAGTELGDRKAYDFLVEAVAFKPGAGFDPRYSAGAAERLAKLSPAVSAFILGTQAGSTEYTHLRSEMEKVAIRIGGSIRDADKAHLGLEFLPVLDAYSAAWVKEQEAAFQAGGPKPEAEIENEGGERSARPRPGGTDEPEAYEPPTPFGRK